MMSLFANIMCLFHIVGSEITESMLKKPNQSGSEQQIQNSGQPGSELFVHSSQV